MRDTRWLVILVALLWGCTGTPTPSPTAPDGTSTSSSTVGTTAGPGESTTSTTSTTTPIDEAAVIRVGTVVPLGSLDPADALSLGDWEILNAVGDGLLRIEPGNGEIVAGVAEDLPEVSDDGLTYTFRLRPGIEFADGLPLTASSYVESIERVMRIGGRSSDLVSLYVSSVEAPDESTVVFHLSDSFAFFPILVAGTTYLPTHPDVYPLDELAPLPEPPVYGVGPWYIDAYSESEVVLESNPRYSGDTPFLQRIVIQRFETTEDMAQALSNGDVDLIWRGVDSATAGMLSADEDLHVEEVPGGTMHFLTVNHGLAPTDDPLVRQALAELVDRQPISDAVLGGAFVPAFSPVPPGYVGSSDSFSDIYGDADVAKAIDLLTAAGYTDSNRAQIELAYPPERFGLEMAAAMEAIELQVESTGLIEVTLTAQPWSTYVGDVVEGAYNLAFLGWLHDFPDPHNYLAPFVLGGGLGGSGENLESPDLADLVLEAAMEPDAEQRAELYGEIQTLFAEDVVTIPLWVEHPYIVYRDNVSGSEAFDNHLSLNVGSAMQLDFRALELTSDDR